MAEEILARATSGGPATYIATATGYESDADFSARIAQHRARRDPAWRTYELTPALDLGAALGACPGPVIVDSIGTWVAGHEGFDVDVEGLLVALAARDAPTVLVSDEVGWGVHPSSEAGREFRDALGNLNLRLAELADEALLVVAGRVLELPRSHPPEAGRRG